MRRLLLAGLCALGLAAPAAAQGWPMQHGNAQHTSSTSVTGFSKIRVAWTKDLGVITPAPSAVNAPQSGQGVSVAPDGHLIVSASTAVYKLNSATGELIWTYAPGTAHRFTQALVDANQVYVASSNLVTALNQGTGAMVWQLPISATSPVASTRMSDGVAGFVTRFSSPSAPIALVPGSSWFLITGNDHMDDEGGSGQSYGVISVSTGGFVHAAKHMSANSVHATAIARDGSIIFVKTQDSGSASMQIIAFDSQLTSPPLWSTSSLSGRGEWGIALGTGTLANPAALYSPVYRGSAGTRLRAYNMATGAEIWLSTFAMNYSNFNPDASATPVYDEDNHRVYLNDSSHLHAFDASNGNCLWSQRLAESNATSPTWSIGTPLVAGSTTVLVAAIQRISGNLKPMRLWNLDSSNGDPRWSVTIGSIPFGLGAIYSPAQTPQITPGSGGAFYAHIASRDGFDSTVDWRSFVARYEPANYDAVTVTTSPSVAVTGSTFVRQPAQVRVTQAGSPVSGVPVTLHSHDEAACATTYLSDPSGNSYATGVVSSHSYHTDASGFITMYYEYEPETMAVGCFETLRSTAVVSVPGMADAPIYLSETRVSTYTITRSSPSIEFSTTTGVMFQVSTITISVTGAGGVPLQGVPVRLTRSNYTSLCNATQAESFMTPSTGTALTDAAGTATIVHRLRFTESGGIECQPAQDLPYADAKVSVYVRGAKPTLNMSVLGVSPTTFTVTFSSAALTPDIGHATMTVTVYDAFGSTVPGIPIFLKHLEASSDLVYSYGSYMPNATCSASDFTLYGRSDALGRAEFVLDTRNCTTQDNFVDHLTTAPVFAQGIAVTSPTLTLESDYLESYQVTAPTITSVGVAFRSTVTALNFYGRALPRYNEAGVTLSPLFYGTQVQGTGSLGTSVISFAASPGSVVISSQTYNKIETVQFPVTDEDGRTGLSGPIVFTGPTQFEVTIPTAAQAGVNFQVVVVARDASNNQVLGYNGTVNLAAVMAGNTALSGGGVLGATSLNIAAGLGSTSFQSYTKAEGIRLRVSDSGIGVTSFSSSATVRAGPAASIALLANPQSTMRSSRR